MDMMLVVIAVGLALFYIVRLMYKKLKTPQSLDCGCGCSSCSIRSDSCDSTRKLQ
jgi:hypothetical protein